MRTLSVTLLLAIAAAACTTKRTEGVCCVTEADCAQLGVGEPRPCEVGQACRAFECVAAECATSAECTSPDAPVCIDGLCVASCRVDADCAGAASGPHCASDGACFHLAPTSPARGAAESGTGVTRDLEGRPRPSPSGSVPDMGAFEAP
jgi:hypothetical protein